MRASKTGGARHRYNQASRAASAALQAWRAASGRDDATLFDAAVSSPDARVRVDSALAAASVDGFEAAALRERFEQFASEALDFVPAAGDALARGDFASFGAVVDGSQHAAERLLGNQVPETIALARLAREQGAVAASAFGAGFGGSVWALVRSAESEAFAARWSADYRHAFPQHARQSQFFTTQPCDGLRPAV